MFHKLAHMLSWAGSPSRDVSYARSNNQDKNIIFFNFTRSIPKYVDTNEVFSNIEQLKDGVLFSAKFYSRDLITAIPHIVCLSNYLPMNPSAISLDRWSLYRIGNQTKSLIKMDSQQANDFIMDHVIFENNIQAILDEKTGQKKSKKKQTTVIKQKPHWLTEEEFIQEQIEIEEKIENKASSDIPAFNSSSRYQGLFQSKDQTLVYTPSKQLYLKYGD